MAITCPNCGKEYDVTLFEFENTVKCECGETVRLTHIEKSNSKYNFFKKLLDSIEKEKQKKKLNKLKFSVDKICRMILSKECKDIDIKIEISKFRKEFLSTFPKKENLYNMIYESRFKRLWQQFRE